MSFILGNVNTTTKRIFFCRRGCFIKRIFCNLFPCGIVFLLDSVLFHYSVTQYCLFSVKRHSEDVTKTHTSAGERGSQLLLGARGLFLLWPQSWRGLYLLPSRICVGLLLSSSRLPFSSLGKSKSNNIKINNYVYVVNLQVFYINTKQKVKNYLHDGADPGSRPREPTPGADPASRPREPASGADPASRPREPTPRAGLGSRPREPTQHPHITRTMNHEI